MQTARRGAAVLAALLLVTASVGIAVDQGAEEIAPVQDAEAIVPAIVGGAIVGGAIVGAIQEYLGGDQVAVEDYRAAIAGETDQQIIDLQAGLITENASANQYLTARENHNQDSRSIASMKAKRTIAEEINNGSTDVQNISTATNETIEDYYSRQQYLLAQRYDVHAIHVKYVAQAAHQDENFSAGSIFTTQNVVEEGGEFNNLTTTSNRTTVLANGTQIDTEGVRVNHDHSSGTNRVDHISIGNAETNTAGASDWSWDNNWSVIMVRGIDPEADELKSIDQQTTLDIGRYRSSYLAMNQSTEQLQANYGPSFIEAVLAQYQAGDIETSELVAPEILANEWGTGYNQTGDSTYQWASFGAMGVEMPDLNETAAMQVEYVAPRETRQVTLNVTNADDSLDDSPPYNVTLERDDGTQVRKQIVGSSGTVQNPTFDLPLSDGATVTNATFFFTSPNGGQIVDWSDGGISADYEGVSVESEESFNESVTDWGMLFASDSPSGGWNVSEEYDPDGLGSVYFAPEDGEMDLVRDNFTIHQIRNDTGANLTTVDVRSYNKQTASVGNISEELQQLNDLRDEVEDRAEPVGGGIGFPELGGVGGVGLLLLLGAAFLFLRD